MCAALYPLFNWETPVDLWVIRKHKRVSATMPTNNGGGGAEKRKREGMCGGTHTTFLRCFREDRNNGLTLSYEGILAMERV